MICANRAKTERLGCDPVNPDACQTCQFMTANDLYIALFTQLILVCENQNLFTTTVNHVSITEK